MKILINKLNNTKLSVRLVYIFVIIVFIVSYILLLLSFLKLKGIETLIRIIILSVLGFLLLLYGIGDLVLLLSKKNKTVLVTSFIVMIISSICIVSSSFVNKAYNLLASMNKNKYLYTTNLITLKDTVFSNNKEFVVGIIDDSDDIEGNKLAYELIEKEDLKVTIKKFENNFLLLENLYNKSVDGIFITGNYEVMYQGYEAYEDIGKEVKVVYELEKEIKEKDNVIKSTGSVDKPFTILLMGVDSTSNKLNANAAFNGDTLMIITFNPHTLNATVFSIPRDTYVPIACLKNKDSSKINSSAAYGSKCVIDTVENLIGIKLDYYVKINFKGVVDLVDALGGVDVTVPDNIEFCEQNSKRSFKKKDLLCIKSGYQHMNGEQALAFARHRKTLPAGDFQRVQHQQLVVEGILNSAKNLSSLDSFLDVLDAISMNIDTNMTTDDLLNLYGVGKDVLTNASKNNTSISIQKTYLTGYDLTMYVNNLRSRVYTFQYYEQSLEEIVNAMKINLEQQQPEIVKTFNFSVNDEYKIPVIGKNYYTVKRNETIPDFTSKKLSYVKSWCEARNINVNVNYIEEGDKGYSSTKVNDTVIKQSILRGKLVKDVSNITVDVIKHQEEVTTTTTKKIKTTTTTTSTTTLTTTSSVIEEPINELVE